MDDDQQFCLRWNNHQSTLISVFDTLLENETLVDCTLAAEGKFLKAHKVVLSACSPYFATLLQEQYDKHPIFILKDVKYQELRAMMDYMYRGEVNISQDQLAALLKAAESLQIKGLSDNRTGGGSVPKHEQPQQQQHRGMGLAGSAGGGLGVGKHVAGGYTLEQTKRARLGPASIDSQELSGSREGSSSPTSRRRRKVRRRSIDNVISAADVHDNSNSSQIQPIATTSSILQQQSNASLSGVGAIAAAASALASQVPASVAAALPTATAASSIAGAVTAIQPGTTQQQLTAAAAAAAAASTSVTKKTESVKGSGSSIVSAGGDAMHGDLLVNIDEQQQQLAAAGLELKSEKQNHKQQKSVLGKDVSAAGSSVTSAELVIEPKSEYDEEGNDENVEDLTLDDEDMGMEDLDHNAGTSHGNEGSSQGYAQWQHDRSQDEVFMATQDAQQRDPQGYFPIGGEMLTISPSSRGASDRRHSMRLKTSPTTSPTATPTGTTALPFGTGAAGGVIKYEPSSADDNEGSERNAAACFLGATCHRPGAKNHGGGGEGVVGDDADDNHSKNNDNGDDDDDEQPCDLRLNTAMFMALQQAAIAAAVEHAAPGASSAAAAAAAAAIMPVGVPSGMQSNQPSASLLSTATPTAPHQHIIGFPQPQVPPQGAVTPTRRSSTFSGSGAAGGISPMLPHGLIGVTSTPIGGGASGLGGGSVSTSGPAASTSTGGGGGGGGNPASWGGAYTCERCGNSYARPHSLNRHVRFECGVEPKFECPICHKKSKHKHNLVLHMRTHQHR